MINKAISFVETLQIDTESDFEVQQFLLNLLREQSLDSTPIEELDLSLHAYHALKNARFETAGELKGLEEADLLRFRHISKSEAFEIVSRVEEFFGVEEEQDNEPSALRDNLLITAGCRAGCMDSNNVIWLPEGTEGEDLLAQKVAEACDAYLAMEDRPSFDLYIEDFLASTFKE